MFTVSCGSKDSYSDMSHNSVSEIVGSRDLSSESEAVEEGHLGEGGLCDLGNIIGFLREKDLSIYPSKILISNQVQLTENDRILLERLRNDLGIEFLFEEIVAFSDEDKFVRAMLGLSQNFFTTPDTIVITGASKSFLRRNQYEDEAALRYRLEKVDSLDSFPKGGPFVFSVKFEDTRSKENDGLIEETKAFYTVFFSYHLGRVVHGQCNLADLFIESYGLESCLSHILGFPFVEKNVLDSQVKIVNGDSENCRFLDETG